MVQHAVVRCALYARVSSDKQEQEATIQSQREALRRHAGDKGYNVVSEFLDDGHSGATLQRPGLDRLRDLVAAGDVDLVLFHSPDRLARKALYQGIVLEELHQHGIKAEFGNHAVDDTPEGKMLLDMQAIIAEYERTKIAERTRRGKLYWARQGAFVGGHVPYGYRFIKRTDGWHAHLTVNEH